MQKRRCAGGERSQQKMPGVYFLRKSADHEKIPVSSPEWKEKLPWLETERDCRIHVGVADRRD